MVQIIVIVTDKCKCCTYQYNNQFIWRKAMFIGLYSTVNTELVFENNKEIKNKKYGKYGGSAVYDYRPRQPPLRAVYA